MFVGIGESDWRWNLNPKSEQWGRFDETCWRWGKQEYNQSNYDFRVGIFNGGMRNFFSGRFNFNGGKQNFLGGGKEEVSPKFFDGGFISSQYYWHID